MRFAAYRVGRRIIHGDDIGGVHDLDIEASGILRCQGGSDGWFDPGEQETHAKPACTGQSAWQDDLQAVIPTRRVHGDAHVLVLPGSDSSNHDGTTQVVSS